MTMNIKSVRDVCRCRLLFGMNCNDCECQTDCTQHIQKYKIIPASATDDHILTINKLAKIRKQKAKEN